MSERPGWLLFTIASCALVTLITSHMGFFSLDEDTNQIADVTRNWQAKVILDLQVSFQECPAGYQNVSNSVWPGTTSGCWCGNISSSMRHYYEISRDLYTDYCDSNQTKAGCTNIVPTPAIPMNIWSTVNDTKATLCVQRSNESLADVANYSGNTCPLGKTKCGLSADNTFCVPQGSKCPINDIQMSSLILPDESDRLSQCSSQNNCVVFAQDRDTAQIIHYKRGDTFDASPTAQFRLSEYGMCKDSAQDDVTPGRSVFALFGKKKASCGTEGDIFWNRTVYQVSEKKLFDWNGILPTVQYLTQYGYYDQGRTGDDYRYSLFSRSYIPWKMECRGQMDLLIQNTDEISNLKNIQSILLLWSWITFLLLIIFLPGLICFFTCLCLQKFCLNRVSMTKVIKRIVQCLHYFLRILVILNQIPSLKISKNLVGLYSSIAERGCTTSQVSEIFHTTQKSINTVHYGTIISITYFIFTTVVTLYFFYSDKRKQAINNIGGLSESFADPQPLYYQTSQQYRDPEAPHSQSRGYDIQHLQNQQIYQQQPIAQPHQLAPPAPLENESPSVKPLYEPFNNKNY